jgi:uncharacterized protein with FMN-binding domain
MSNISPHSYANVSRLPRRGAVALVTTVMAVILLLSFKTADQTGLAASLPTANVVGTPGTPTQGPVALGPPAPTPTLDAGPMSGGSTSGNSTPPPTPTAVAGKASGTFTGNAFNTPYGTVQISLTVQNGTITDVKELQMPFDRRLSQQISQVAGPMLVKQVLQAQSANIQGVSGASYTSYGFYESLQSALAKMG